MKFKFSESTKNRFPKCTDSKSMSSALSLWLRPNILKSNIQNSQHELFTKFHVKMALLIAVTMETGHNGW